MSTQKIYTATNFLNTLCDAMVSYHIPGSTLDFKVSIEMPSVTYEKFLSELKSDVSV